MAATLNQIAQYLDNRDWKYDSQPENSRIITGVKAESVDRLAIAISLKENGEYLELAAPNLLHVKSHVYKGVLFQTMLAISWETKMIRWEYDPLDGEIRASIAFPLEDAPLYKPQFDRALSGLIHIVDTLSMPRLQAVLATGIDPGQKELGEKLLETLQEILPDGSLKMLQDAIAARKQRGTI